MSTKLKIFVVALLTTVVAGCSIQPLKITPQEQEQLTKTDLSNMFEDQEPIKESISLYDAMARAVVYNLDYRVQIMEEALRRGELETAKGDLLPTLTVAAGYNSRNNEQASSSQSLIDGSTSVPTSISTEKQYSTSSATFTWNVLDFGVSYAQAKQQADQILISQEKKRKAIQNIIQDVRFSYWRAVSAERLLPEMSNILKEATDTLKKVDILEEFSIQSPMVYLNYRKELLSLIREMWKLRENLSTAKSEFAALVNIRPGQEFTLKTYNEKDLKIPEIGLSLEHLEGYALANRPDIREEHYQARISVQEIKKAMARMLPGLELTYGHNYDSNKFLLNSDWNQLGLSISWNIFNLFNGRKAIAAAEALNDLDNARRLSLQMAVLTQVHLATQRYHISVKNYELAKELNQIERKIYKQTSAIEQSNMQNQLEVLRTRASALIANMTGDLSYAEMENAYGKILGSIGIDPFPSSIEKTELNHIAQLLEENLNNWQSNIN